MEEVQKGCGTHGQQADVWRAGLLGVTFTAGANLADLNHGVAVD